MTPPIKGPTLKSIAGPTVHAITILMHVPVGHQVTKATPQKLIK